MSTRKQTAAALKAVDKALQQAAQVQILLSRAALAARLAGLHDTAAEMDNIDTALGAGMRQYTDMLISRVSKAAADRHTTHTRCECGGVFCGRVEQ